LLCRQAAPGAAFTAHSGFLFIWHDGCNLDRGLRANPGIRVHEQE
jgi:hypothetical protein